MPALSNLEPLTVARIEVVPAANRTLAVRQFARQGSTAPTIGGGAGPSLGPHNSRLMLGLRMHDLGERSTRYSGLISTYEYELADEAPIVSSDASATHSQHRERLFVLDGLSLSQALVQWNPPLRVLLIATAATIIATLEHDPRYKTYVACRVPVNDGMAKQAAVSLGAQRPETRIEQHFLAMYGLPSAELYFLDGPSVRTAADYLLGHLSGEVRPSLEYMLPGHELRVCKGRLLLELPKVLRELSDDLVEIILGQNMIDWPLPTVPVNDADLLNTGRTLVGRR